MTSWTTRSALLAAALACAGVIAFALRSPVEEPPIAQVAASPPPGLALATFAGGCFWCMEPPYDKLDGVVSTTSGYMGGRKRNPSYEEVSSGSTGHTEVVQVAYDPTKVSYETLLEVFWVNVDPTVKDRQFCDHGTQYRTSIFVHTPEQRKAAEASKANIERTKPFSDPIVTPIESAGEFWPAEEYHQDFYLKNPARYSYYRTGCGRDARLKQLWGAKAAS
jgi:peptide-methionine (S)-S-oxide reductase